MVIVHLWVSFFGLRRCTHCILFVELQIIKATTIPAHTTTIVFLAGGILIVHHLYFTSTHSGLALAPASAHRGAAGHDELQAYDNVN
jgi:nitric oxide reductase large subunit